MMIDEETYHAAVEATEVAATADECQRICEFINEQIGLQWANEALVREALTTIIQRLESGDHRQSANWTGVL